MAARATTRVLTDLDTGEASSFIRKSLIQKEHYDKIRPLAREVHVPDSNKRPLVHSGQIRLPVRLGDRTELVLFYVTERLAAPALLGFDFCDKHVEAIRPRKRIVELDKGTTVPIVWSPRTRSPSDAPLPQEQEFMHTKSRTSTKITVKVPKTLSPGS